MFLRWRRRGANKNGWISAAGSVIAARTVATAGVSSLVFQRQCSICADFASAAMLRAKQYPRRDLAQLRCWWQPAVQNWAQRISSCSSSRRQQRQASSWSPSALLASASEFLFSDTLDQKTLAGVDSQGNKYFDVVRTFRANNTQQRLRIVEPATGVVAADYDPNSVPTQWRSWLNYSRSDAPTAEELQKAEAAQQERAANVAAAKERGQHGRNRRM